ncbi:hypothetical protein [Mesorhizobium prunaredense]|uniref:hypothetical protein n=1 Tax=Mesorhizobium prunaredense TaxID=1631249 RepID=UPI001AECD5FC|nr:hypothetical protein [Mesorhizobium prunaredense]
MNFKRMNGTHRPRFNPSGYIRFQKYTARATKPASSTLQVNEDPAKPLATWEGRTTGSRELKPSTFVQCPICNQSIDMRDLGQVLHHADEEHDPVGVCKLNAKSPPHLSARRASA